MGSDLIARLPQSTTPALNILNLELTPNAGAGFAAVLAAQAASGAVGGFTSGYLESGFNGGTSSQSLETGVIGGATAGALSAGVAWVGSWLGQVGAERTTPALNILNPEFTPYASDWLQNATNCAASELGANPALARGALSEPEYNAAVKSFGIARMQYGNAVEDLVRQAWEDDSLAQQILDYTGNGPGPDFMGLGSAQGQTFDISTSLGREPHWRCPYGPGMQIITYSRPPGFTVFPAIKEVP
ncbi:MAG: hypothetical protein POH28_16385 [Acidocella sp.]|nr:hypothetical protein [Acidocella sp.]